MTAGVRVEKEVIETIETKVSTALGVRILVVLKRALVLLIARTLVI